jgi:hypothetical protein
MIRRRKRESEILRGLPGKLLTAMKAMRILISFLATLWFCTPRSPGQEPTIPNSTLLFADNATWKALYRSVRPNEENELRPLRVDPSLQTLLDAALKDADFLRVQRPVVRLLMQDAAWHAFDSLASERNYHEPANRALRMRLARVIAASALTEEEIKHLPATHTGAAIGDDQKRNTEFDVDLPTDLLEKGSDWLQLTYKNLDRIALTHEMSRGGRSEFLLFVRFPNGSKPLEDYLRSHNEYAVAEGRRRNAILNFMVDRVGPVPPIPKFPAHARAVLLERMLAISDRGVPVATPISRSLAMIDFQPAVNAESGRLHGFRAAAFKLSPDTLLGKETNVHLRRLKEREPFTGETHFPLGLQQCSTCHGGGGLISLTGGVAGMILPPNRAVDSLPKVTASDTQKWKMQQPEFGLLRGLLEGLDLAK